MLAGSLRSRRIIRQVLRQLGYGSSAIFKWIKKNTIISEVSAARRSLFSVSAACRQC